jgi:hypothetical protein
MLKLNPEHVILGTVIYTKEDCVLSLMKEITNLECNNMKHSHYQVIKFGKYWTVYYMVGNIATVIDDYAEVSKQDIVDFFDKLQIVKIILF